MSVLKPCFNLVSVCMKKERAKQMDVMISLANEFLNLSIFLLLAAFRSLRENRIFCAAFITHIKLEDLHNSFQRLPTRIMTLLSFFHPPNLKYTYLEVDLSASSGNWLVLEAPHQQVKAHSFVALKTDFFRCLATVILCGPSWHTGSRKCLLSILGKFVGRKRKGGCFPLYLGEDTSCYGQTIPDILICSKNFRYCNV